MNGNSKTGSEIAIIGMAGAFPGAADIDQFFNNLKRGVHSIAFFSDDELESSGIPGEAFKKRNFVKAKGYLDQCEYFDNMFFGYTPNEAQYLDPQTRLLHEFSWKALEDAGYPPGLSQDSIGVYVGGRPHFFWELMSFSEGTNNGAEDFELSHLNDKDLMSTRVSYKLNLKGPSVTIYTACSTSLVAVHVACQGILNGECGIALAGGVSITSPLKNGYYYQEGMILSPDGYCRPFDAKASGTVAGNGIGLVVLKRLEAAINDGDQIYAVIKGSAINNDGSRKVGYTAPSVEGQAEVIKAAHRVAAVEPDTISYVEAHGTGTALGDPIEVKALTKAFDTNKRNYCGLGSVKSNIGHLDSAAGVAGLIKTVLSLKHGLLFPSLHFSKPNTNIEFEDSPFYIVDCLKNWERTGSPLRAGVSSFGVGGTNAHVVLEEAPVTGNAKREKNARLILFSAKTEESLIESMDNMAKHIRLNPELDFTSMSYTLQKGRSHFQYRSYAVCDSLKDVCKALSSKAAQSSCLDSKRNSRSCYFVLFEGDVKNTLQNYKYYLNNEISRDVFNSFLLKLTELTNIQSSDFLNFNGQYRYGHMAVFLFNMALAEWLIKMGVTPSGIIGNGIGEYAAACLAGVFSLEDAFALIEKRNQLLEELEGQREDFLLIESLQSDYYQTMKDIPLNAPEIPLICGHDGKDISNDVMIQDYWVNNLNADYKHYKGIRNRNEAKSAIYIMFEAKEQWEREAEPEANTDLKQEFIFMSQSGVIADGGKFVLEQLGRLWFEGSAINWDMLYKNEDRRRISLPGYPFVRKRFWYDTEKILKLNNYFKDSAEKTITRSDKSEWLYTQSWVRSEQETAAPEHKSRLFVVFSVENPLVEKCMEKLRSLGHKTVIVEAGDEFCRLGTGKFAINPDNKDDFDLLFKAISDEAGEPEGILHFWSLNNGRTDEEMNMEQSNRLGYYTLLDTARAIGNLNIGKNVSIDIITDRLFEVIGNETVNPVKATLLGPVRVIPREYPHIRCRLMDVDDPEYKGLCDVLLNEIFSKEHGNDIYAIRNNYRWEPIYRNIRHTQPLQLIPKRLKHGGVYVITGGLGGIGLIIGRFLAEKLRAKIVFLNRSNFLPASEWDRWCEVHGDDDPIARKIKLLKDIKTNAGGLAILKADIAKEAEVDDSFRRIISEYGTINGILHTAGVPDGSVIQRRSREMSEAVFAAKIYGTMAIQKAMQKLNLNPDFLLLFSSLSTIIAPPAQVAYCSANAFLDAFAEYNMKKGIITQAIAWDMWKNTGMAAAQMAYRVENLVLPTVTYKESDHPMFRYYIRHNTGSATFISVFNTTANWFLDEHRIVDKAVLPGTCYIEMACSAYKQVNENDSSVIKVYDVFFITPLVADNGADVIVRTKITGDKNKCEFIIESYSAENGGYWLSHAYGRICAAEDNKRHYRLDDIGNRCDGIHYNQSHYNNVRDSMFRYGPRWNSYREGRFNNNQGLSLIELPSRFSADMSQFCIHPAIVDVALVYMDKSLMKSYQYAPFSYKSITIYGNVPRKVYSYIRLGAESLNNSKIIEFDISIIDEYGNGIIEIEGYKMAAVTDEKINMPLLSNEVTAVKHETPGESAGGMSADEGLYVLNAALSACCPRIIVSTADLQRRVDNYRNEKVSIYAMPDDVPGENRGENVPAERLSDEEMEKVLTDIWKKVLGHDEISRDDDFFELGGDSLKILTMAERIHQQINIKIPISVYFNLPTIEKLVRHIKTTYNTGSQYNRIEKTSKRKYYELSSAQKRLYYQQQVLPDNMAYNIPEVILVEGDFDVDRLQYAFERLIERHAVLRTWFDVINGDLVQIIEDKVDFRIEYLSADESEVPQIVESFMQPFDLRIPPLLRVKVVKFDSRKYIWLFDIHHIIADNISVMVLQNELINIYNNGIDTLPDINLEYVDFVYWQNDLIRKGYYDKQYKYWLKQLEGQIPALTLPTDFIRPPVLSYQGDVYTFYLEGTPIYNMKKIMKANTATLYMYMMAVFCILLHKYAGTEDFLVGTSLAGRNHADLEKMVGMFANVLPFRSKIDSGLSFSEYLGVVKENILDLFENQDAQFEVLVEKLGHERNLGANPLFNVMLVMPDFKPAEMAMDNVKLHSYPFRNKSSKFDLTLWVYDYDSRIELRLEYSTDLFTRKTIETMAKHFTDIARQVAECPDALIKDILLESNYLKTDFAKSVYDDGDFAF